VTKRPHLDNLPSSTFSSGLNEWADFAEMSCLFSNDGEVSWSDIFLRHEVENVDDDESEIPRNELDDFDSMAGADIFRLIRARKEILGEYYPFELVDEDTICIANSFDVKKVFYSYLLFSSNLRLVDRSCWKDLTGAFEHISAHILRIIYPSFTCEVFGTSHNSSGVFSGSTRGERLGKLAELLHGSLTTSLQRDPSLTTTAGDEGLDVVAFCELDASRGKVSKIPVCLAQCSCSYSEWVDKQQSITTGRWQGKIEGIASCHEYIFVPFPVRDSRNMWHPTFESDIIVTLVDRIRIINILSTHEDDLSFFAEMEVCSHLTRILKEGGIDL